MCGENLQVPDTLTARQSINLSSESNETPAHGDISVDGSVTSSSDESRPFPMMVRTAERKLDPLDDEMARSWGEPERRRERSIKT